MWGLGMFDKGRELGGKRGRCWNEWDGWFVGMSGKVVGGGWVGGE